MSSPTTLTSKGRSLAQSIRAVGGHVPGVALVLQALEEAVELGWGSSTRRAPGSGACRRCGRRARCRPGTAARTRRRSRTTTARRGRSRRRRLRACRTSRHRCRRPAVARPRVASFSLPSSRPSRLSSSARRYGALAMRVVAQRHDHQLGGERLLGVPGRALVLAATALGAGREVEDALPAEVLGRADAELGVLVEVLEVVEGQRLAVAHHRLGRAERDRLAPEQHVQRAPRRCAGAWS